MGQLSACGVALHSSPVLYNEYAVKYVGVFLSISYSRGLDEQELHAAATALQGFVWLDWTDFCNLAATFLYKNLAIPCFIGGMTRAPLSI